LSASLNSRANDSGVGGAFVISRTSHQKFPGYSTARSKRKEFGHEDDPWHKPKSTQPVRFSPAILWSSLIEMGNGNPRWPGAL
jgi:hypothetical protein